MSTKKLNTILFLTLFFLNAVCFKPILAQPYPADKTTVKQLQINRQDNLVSLDMELDIDQIEISKNGVLIITPLLQSNSDEAVTDSFPPLIINGSIRNKVMNRQKALNIPNYASTLDPIEIIKKGRHTPQIYSYYATVPFEQWMKNASLVLVNENRGCADCDLGSDSKILLARAFREKTIPQFRLTYIEPVPEPVKARSERHSASLSYQFDRYNLLRDYKNNAAEIGKVEKIIKEIQNNKDLTITELTIEGFASPEGGFDYNRKLSGNRANSFADFLVTKYHFDRRQLKNVSGIGEDWAGLRKAVEASQIAYKKEILHIIDSVFPPDARDAKLMALSGGKIYRQLLIDFYPSLRRTDYIFGYNVRDFSVEEAKEKIRVNPELLSLNEMYLVAETYPKESKEFKEVFDIAARLYPNDPLAIINSAATEIETGNFSEAIKQLEKIKKDPRAWNNLGVAYAKKGDMKTAKDYFEKANAQNDAAAKVNKSILEQIEENQ
ncbi:MAG: DUF3868 domain-containing protein [Proteiniphilum sp.]